MSERYSPDTHPNQIKEQTNDKQYLELYNAAQRCFNLPEQTGWPELN